MSEFKPSQMISRDKIDDEYDKLVALYKSLKEDLSVNRQCYYEVVEQRNQALKDLSVEREVNRMLRESSETDRYRIYELEDRVVEAEKEVQQWKANHADMVNRNAVLTQRPDLPIDRIPIYERLVAELSKCKQDLEGTRLYARDQENNYSQAVRKIDSLTNDLASAQRSVSSQW